MIGLDCVSTYSIEVKQTVQLGALSAANIGIVFLFQWFVITQLGPGIETDALFAGMTMPQMALAVISGSLMHVLVPLLAGEEKERLRHDAWGFLVLIGGLFGMLAVGLYVTAPLWIPLTVPGFDDAGKALAVELTRIQLIGMVFAAVNGVQWATCHARQQFLWAEFTPILSSVLGLLLLFWTLPRYGVVAAAWIGTLRMALQTFFLAPAMGMPVWPNLRGAAINEAWRRIQPLLLGTAYYKTDPLVDRFLLSMAGSGNLSLYYLAQQIYGAANQVINRAIAAPLVPFLSKLSKAGDGGGFKLAYHRIMWQVGLIVCGGLFVFVVAGPAALDVFIGYGSLHADKVQELWWIMIWLAGVFVGGAMGQICASSFYACGDTITPTRMSVVTYTVYVPCKVVFFYLWGVKGVALITSIYYMSNFLLQVYLLRGKRIS